MRICWQLSHIDHRSSSRCQIGYRFYEIIGFWSIVSGLPYAAYKKVLKGYNCQSLKDICLWLWCYLGFNLRPRSYHLPCLIKMWHMQHMVANFNDCICCGDYAMSYSINFNWYNENKAFQQYAPGMHSYGSPCWHFSDKNIRKLRLRLFSWNCRWHHWYHVIRSFWLHATCLCITFYRLSICSKTSKEISRFEQKITINHL